MLENLLIVKLGGGEGLDLMAACADLERAARGRPLVVVHGVSAAMNRLCREKGIEVQTLTSPGGHSSRYTPPAVRDVYVCAAETVNSEIVAELRRHGIAAAGFVGQDVALCGQRKAAIRSVANGRIRLIRDDYSGTIHTVAAQRLRTELAARAVPVLPPLASSDEGALNVDGDRAAAAVASALTADTLVILSNVRGLYRDFPNEDSFIDEVKFAQIDSALEWAQGRMKRKVLAAREALDGGVGRVIIADGRVENSISRALDGEGTWFSK